MQRIIDLAKRSFSLTLLLVFAAYGFTRCVSYSSYVSNFGLMTEPHGYISTIPFMAGASLGVVIAGLLILAGYLLRKLQPCTIPYRAPLLLIIVMYILTLANPGAFENDIALAALGFVWGLATTFASTAAVEFLLYESSPVLIIITLATASLLTAAMSILSKMYPQLAGPLDLFLAAVSLVLIGSLRKKSWCLKPVTAPSNTLSKTLRLSLAPIMASAIFELVVGLINMFSYTGASSFQIETDSPVIGMLFSGIAVTIIVAVVRRAPQEQVVYSVVYPAVIALILLIPFFGDVLGKAASMLLYSAYLFTSMLSMFCCLRACQKTHDCIYGVMGIFTLALRLCLVAGLLLGWWLGSLQDSEGFMQLSLACVICIYLLGLVLVLRNAGKRIFQPEHVQERPLEDKSEALIIAFENSKTPTNKTCDNADTDESCVSMHESETATLADNTLDQRLNELTRNYSLTNRERDVLKGLAQGNTAASIAEELCLSTSTVQSYTKTLYAKLGLNKKQQVIDLVMKGKDH